MAVINVRMLLTLLAPFVLTLQMHTDVGDRARGRRPSGITDVGQGPVQQRLGISDCQILSLERSFKCVRYDRCLRINITIRQ